MSGERPQNPVMDWTVLPAKVTAKAWTDTEYRSRLLDDPVTEISSVVSDNVPANIRVVADADGIRHLPLPQRPVALAEDDELREQLNDETGGDATFEWMLPAEITGQALTDSEFRARLLRSPAEAGCPQAIQIVENTEEVRWLVLPEPPTAGSYDSAEEVRQRLLEQFGGIEFGGTTTCCAGGTRT